MQITSTPWGVPQGPAQGFGPGIAFYSTASHGGFFLDAEHNGQIPLSWRRASFNGRGMAGWYEEDCDWCLVALAFPSRFTERELADARRTFDVWIAPKLADAKAELATT